MWKHQSSSTAISCLLISRMTLPPSLEPMVNAYRITRTVATVAMPGVAIVGAGLFVAAPWPRTVQVHAIQLVDSADSPLGDGTALVFGDGGVSIPPPQYVDAADTLYLQAGIRGRRMSPPPSGYAPTSTRRNSPTH